MEIVLEGNKTYVAAISGGIDSMVLFDLLIKLRNENKWNIIVAHVDHGIREDSSLDKSLVEETAKTNNLPFESVKLNLGKNASEDLARRKRYEFLNKVKDRYKANAILTAHHQDDLIETVILNFARGTNRKGLSPLMNTPGRLRPLLNYTKEDIKNYAVTSNIRWREDSTNTDTNYLRNYIRLNILPRINASARAQLLNVINMTSSINNELDTDLKNFVRANSKDNNLNRVWFTCLPHAVAKEVLATWLRDNDLGSFNSLTLERLVVSAKVAKVGQYFPILRDHYLSVRKDSLSISLLSM